MVSAVKTTRIMWIENKGGGELAGPARIGRVTFSKSGQSIYYRDHRFETLKGDGFKSNYRNVDTGEEYWISGCRKDGRDALYSTTVEIDEDVREEYWREIRGTPNQQNLKAFVVSGKY